MTSEDTTKSNTQIKPPGNRNPAPAQSLGAAFGGPNRGAAVAGVLQPLPAPAAEPPVRTEAAPAPTPRPVEQKPQPTAQAPKHAVDESVDGDAQEQAGEDTQEQKQAKARTRRAGQRKPSRRAVGRRPSTSARLGHSLKKRLERYSARTGGRTYAAVLIEAFELHHQEIPVLFAPKPAAAAPLMPALGRLFPPRPEVVKAVSSEGTEQVNFTLTAVERDILHGLLDQYPDVPDRNKLIVAVLRRHLDDVEPEIPSDQH
ncbi:hypothetical protein AB0M47_21145 [Hamadaea sp. NPDC051192]|uniref:hypothetical protein n=1 Tax=Hamadaea sp. NPDC051192 TaxID=3154940 RepID=UPI00344AC455